MKIILVTVMSPALENVRGTSALPYHLMVDRDKRIDIEAYSFNLNNLSLSEICQSEKDLDIKIHLIDQPLWFKLIFKFHLLFLRLFLIYPLHNYIRLPQMVVDEICQKSPDGVWIYGEELSRVSKQLDKFNRVHTLPDCESLYYYRLLGRRFVMRDSMKYWKTVFMYPKFLKMERYFDASPSVHYHLVGEQDVAFLNEINPDVQAHFLRHPHYEVALPYKQIIFSQPKIKLLIAGQYNLYMKEDADLLIELLCDKNTVQELHLTDNYQITFLGRGWNNHIAELKSSGWDVHHVTFAPDYMAEIRRHDIQISPICIGTGTKGKVLDAFANGLLVIGSWFALENIDVENHYSCLQYNTVDDILSFLYDISLNIEKYEKIAENGRKAILKSHDRKEASKELFASFISSAKQGRNNL